MKIADRMIIIIQVSVFRCKLYIQLLTHDLILLLHFHLMEQTKTISFDYLSP